MMKPIINTVHSPDITDLSTFAPEDPECFGFLLQLLIGPEGQEGEESFELVVCTPRWMAQAYRDKAIMLGQYHLIVFQYDWSSIRAYLDQMCAKCEGQDWGDVTERLSRIAKWEFDNYLPFRTA